MLSAAAVIGTLKQLVTVFEEKSTFFQKFSEKTDVPLPWIFSFSTAMKIRSMSSKSVLCYVPIIGI